MEKVIKGLECHAKGSRGCLFDCPYGNENGCQLLLCSDALVLLKEQEHKDRMYHALEDDWKRLKELLKEQEAQSVLSNRVCEVEPFRYVRKGFCPKCHQEMEWLFNRKHCGFCGQAVKWE